jgi:hypothetical protein
MRALLAAILEASRTDGDKGLARSMSRQFLGIQVG